jgi:hypothetical protein
VRLPWLLKFRMWGVFEIERLGVASGNLRDAGSGQGIGLPQEDVEPSPLAPEHSSYKKDTGSNNSKYAKRSRERPTTSQLRYASILK